MEPLFIRVTIVQTVSCCEQTRLHMQHPPPTHTRLADAHPTHLHACTTSASMYGCPGTNKLDRPSLAASWSTLGACTAAQAQLASRVA
jgi:hypothetical protein